jgi:cytochrome c
VVLRRREVYFVLGLAAVGLLMTGCGTVMGASQASSTIVEGGDPGRGRQAIERYGCGACHTIPNVPGARGKVGPELEGLGERVMIAGQLANTPDNLMLWIEHPQRVSPGTAMPEMGVTHADARDIAAFLLAQ